MRERARTHKSLRVHIHWNKQVCIIHQEKIKRTSAMNLWSGVPFRQDIYNQQKNTMSDPVFAVDEYAGLAVDKWYLCTDLKEEWCSVEAPDSENGVP